MSEEKKSFEERLARLNEIVEKMEKETLPLEESLRLYEEGKALIASLGDELSAAERKAAEALGHE